MVYIWFIYGLFMVYLWLIYGLYMVDIWFRYGLYMVYIWFIYGWYMVYIWFIYGLYMVYIWLGTVSEWIVYESSNTCTYIPLSLDILNYTSIMYIYIYLVGDWPSPLKNMRSHGLCLYMVGKWIVYG